MNKIKQINISDFRIYQEKQEFKFQNDKGIANLVALYAPNGYGKTSFFDAVEWVYSDEISRIELIPENEVKELDHNENLKDKIILTNRLSYKKDPNIRGRVEFLTEKGNLSKEVDLVTRRLTGTKYDYKKGKVSGDLKLSDDNNLVEFNILSQDQIDNFLRQLPPEKKFDKLKDFWTEGAETLNKYQKVNNTIKNIDKKFKELKTKIKDLNTELKEIVFDPKKLNEINESLEELEKEEIFDSNFTQLEEPLSKELFDILSKELSLAEKNLTNKRKKEEEKLHELKQLISRHPLYKENQGFLKPVKIEIKDLLDKKKFYNILKSAETEKEDIEKNLQVINKKLSDYKKIANHRELFIETEKKIKDLKADKEKNNKTKQQLELNVAVAEKWISSLSKTKSNWVNDFNTSEKEEEKYKSIFEKYSLDSTQNIEDRKQLPILKNNISEIQKEIDTKTKLISNYKSYITESNWIKDVFEITKWNEKIKEYKSISSELKSKKEIIKEKNETFKKAGNLKENLERIKLWGKEYVEDTKDNNCPLCDTPFNNFEALLKEIDANTEDLLKTEDQSKVIDELERRIRGFEKQLITLNKFFTTRLNSSIDRINDEIDAKNKEKENALIKVNLIQRRINLFSEEYVNFIESLKKLIKKGEEYSDSIIPNLIERYTEKKDSINDKIERIQAVIDWKYEYSHLKKDVKITLIEKISETDKALYNQENNTIYQNTKSILKEHQISKEKLVTEIYVNQLIAEEEKVFAGINKTKDDTLKKIEEVKEKIKNSNCKIEKLELDGTLSDKELVKINLEKDLKDYEEDYQKLFIEPSYSDKEIEIATQLCNNILEKLENYEKTLLPIIADLELIEKGLRKQDIEEQLESLKKEDNQLKILDEKVLNLRKACIEYIQSGISNYFNKEVINQIYQRIEPHPELKEIGFKAEMGVKGPRLVITAIGSEDEINPNLFLSAGQVNVLSLSIFLAKAFEYGENTISTIFMDDPIQNLSDVNILSFIDVLRSLIDEHDKQIVISTHDEKFFRLLQNKLPEEYCNTKYIEFESEGKLKKQPKNM